MERGKIITTGAEYGALKERRGKGRNLVLNIVLILFVFPMFILQGTSTKKNQKKSSPGHLFHQNLKIEPRLQNEILSSLDLEKTFKIWIYFTDKGITSQVSLASRLAEVRQGLKDRCIWRRRKVRTEENLVDAEDLPVYMSYAQKVRSTVKRVRTVSRWLNAMSVEANILEIQALAEQEFVRKIDLVVSFRRHKFLLPQRTGLEEVKKDNINIEYGLSFRQLDQINVLPLHQLGYSGRGVLVCMMDTGFRKSHEIFQHSNIVAEWDFVNNDGDVQQDLFDPDDYSDSHGTGTWSILGGYKPGELIGPAYGADFILAKTETTIFEQPIEEDYWVAGIEWAEALGAEVVSSSLGYTDWYTFEDMNGETAVTTIAADRAVSLGVVVVTAAGNERNKSWGHIIAPADGFGVISVGAVDYLGNISSFSSPGPTYDERTKPEVCALGVDNWLAANTQSGSDTYQKGSGTSFSTPLVAGVAAVLLEVHRDWTPSQVRSALLSTASRSLNPDNDYGWGIVNAGLAAILNIALPRLYSYTIDDDNIGESYGNGNGKAEAGETLEMNISLKNESPTPSSFLEGTLSSTHPEIRISPSKVRFPPILPFATQSSEKPFVIEIPHFLTGYRAILRLKIEGPNSLSSYETIIINISR